MADNKKLLIKTPITNKANGGYTLNLPNKSDDEDYTIATTDDIPNNSNIENGTGTGAVYQSYDTGYSDTIDMSVKNPNAWAIYQASGATSSLVNKGATGNYASSFGGISAAQGKRASAEGTNTIAIGKYSHAEGDNSVALGNESHAEGNQTATNGSAAHSEGFNTQAIGNNAHAEGAKTIAYAENAHSEGYASIVKDNYIIVDHGTTPQPIPPEPVPPTPPTPEELDALNGIGAHSEGHNTFVLGCGAHAEGDSTKAYGRLSHVEGKGTQTGELVLRKTEDNKDYYTPDQDKQFQHAEGENTKAIGHASHAGGYETIAGYDYQTVVGKYNANKEHTLFEVGYGWSNGERHNALEVYDDGHATVGGKTIATTDDIPAIYLRNAQTTVDTLTITPSSGDAIIFNNYYPNRSYTSGLQISTANHQNYANGALFVPNATDNQAGIVTTDAQTFAGTKSFSGEVKINPSSSSSYGKLSIVSPISSTTATDYTGNKIVSRRVNGASSIDVTLNFPAKNAGTYTLATTDDITNMYSYDDNTGILTINLD